MKQSRPEIIVYTSNEEKKKAIKLLCRKHRIFFMEIGKNDLSRTMAELLGGISISKNSSSIPVFYLQPEIMVLSGFGSDHMDVFLAAYKKEGIEPIELKAVITPYNLNWTVYELTQELKKEHRELNK